MATLELLRFRQKESDSNLAGTLYTRGAIEADHARGVLGGFADTEPTDTKL